MDTTAQLHSDVQALVSALREKEKPSSVVTTTTAITRQPLTGIPKLDAAVELVKSLGFPMVMCGLMAWVFFIVGKELFATMVENGRAQQLATTETAKAQAAAFKIQADAAERIAKQHEAAQVQHASDMKSIANLYEKTATQHAADMDAITKTMAEMTKTLKSIATEKK